MLKNNQGSFEEVYGDKTLVETVTSLHDRLNAIEAELFARIALLERVAEVANSITREDLFNAENDRLSTALRDAGYGTGDFKTAPTD